MSMENVEYVGFWKRVVACLIDTLILLAILIPALAAIYGAAYLRRTGLFAGPADFLLQCIAPAAIVIGFWLWKQATPGKMVVGAKVVDAKTGGTMSVGQSIGRYLGYFVSSIPFGLGLLWVAFDKKKQGWHDKLAGTVVIRAK